MGETGLRALPTQANLRSVAATIGRPYRQVLDAALRDTGYLTDSDIVSPRPHDEVLADAIRVLTEAAQLTNTPMRRTSTGTWEPDPTGTPQPIDWAAFVTLALAGAAANIGSRQGDAPCLGFWMSQTADPRLGDFPTLDYGHEPLPSQCRRLSQHPL